MCAWYGQAGCNLIRYGDGQWDKTSCSRGALSFAGVWGRPTTMHPLATLPTLPYLSPLHPDLLQWQPLYGECHSWRRDASKAPPPDEHYGCFYYGDFDGFPPLLPLQSLYLSLKLILSGLILLNSTLRLPYLLLSGCYTTDYPKLDPVFSVFCFPFEDERECVAFAELKSICYGA